jgi:hypothetical protein
MLALIAAYRQFQDAKYSTAATTIGNWIYLNLADTSTSGYGGYFTGYPDQGAPKVLQKSKSTQNNADIYAAFSQLAALNSVSGDAEAASLWLDRANMAGDFVMQMFDPASGHFFAGTVPAGQQAGPGVNPTGSTKGNDVINTFDFLDAQTLPTLALAQSPRYRNQIDWTRPISWIVSPLFQRTVRANSNGFVQGFDLIDSSEHASQDIQGVAWEFTGQAVEAMQFVDAITGSSQFASNIPNYLGQLQQAQSSAPFVDGLGLVAATLQNGDAVQPNEQCLLTPFQCIPERVGLAATAWETFA